MPDTLSPSNPSAPTALVHMDALPAGTRLGEFEIQALLGVGGFGMVYRGYDHSLHPRVRQFKALNFPVFQWNQGLSSDICGIV